MESESMDRDALQRLLDLRKKQFDRAVREAGRSEVEWLEQNGYPVWVYRDGRVVDATGKHSAEGESS